MSELSIKVNIAGRTYPLTISMDEEEKIRKAVNLINSKINHLESNYAVKDKQDLLAMTVLEYATQVMEDKLHTTEDEEVVEKLDKLSIEVSNLLEDLR